MHRSTRLSPPSVYGGESGLEFTKFPLVSDVKFSGKMNTSRQNTLQKTQTEQKEMTAEGLQLQQELETLRQMRSSVNALNHMTLALQKTLESIAKNSNDMKNLNEGWEIFFGQK